MDGKWIGSICQRIWTLFIIVSCLRLLIHSQSFPNSFRVFTSNNQTVWSRVQTIRYNLLEAFLNMRLPVAFLSSSDYPLIAFRSSFGLLLTFFFGPSDHLLTSFRSVFRHSYGPLLIIFFWLSSDRLSQCLLDPFRLSNYRQQYNYNWFPGKELRQSLWT